MSSGWEGPYRSRQQAGHTIRGANVAGVRVSLSQVLQAKIGSGRGSLCPWTRLICRPASSERPERRRRLPSESALRNGRPLPSDLNYAAPCQLMNRIDRRLLDSRDLRVLAGGNVVGPASDGCALVVASVVLTASDGRVRSSRSVEAAAATVAFSPSTLLDLPPPTVPNRAERGLNPITQLPPLPPMVPYSS